MGNYKYFELYDVVYNRYNANREQIVEKMDDKAREFHTTPEGERKELLKFQVENLMRQYYGEVKHWKTKEELIELRSPSIEGF